MKPNFSHSIDSLKKIEENSSGDIALAESAADELESFVNNQAQIINDYADLKSILTSDSEVEIRNALIAMRHVTTALSELANFHRGGLLVDAFDTRQHRANKCLDETMKKANVLFDLIKG